jgi:hypothetical protein
MLSRLSTVAKKHGVTRQSVLQWTTQGRGRGDKREVLPSQNLDGVVFVEDTEIEDYLKRTEHVGNNLVPLLKDIATFLVDNDTGEDDEDVSPFELRGRVLLSRIRQHIPAEDY